MRLLIGLIAITLFLMGCSQSNENKTHVSLLQTQPQVMEQPQYQELQNKQALELEFHPSPKSEIQELSIEKPQNDEVFLNKIEVHTGNEKSIFVHLYTHKDNKNLVYGYLQDKDTWYGLGRVSDEGRSNVSPSHWRGGTVPEFEVNGSFGLSIFYYKEDVSRWVKDNDFQEHHIYKMDLDGDKIDELIDTLGTQDPYVALYRWNHNVNQFETAHIAPTAIKFFTNITEQSPQFCFLFQENGKWYIQSGNGDVYSFFEYKNGSITRVELSDTRNRLKEKLRH